MVLVNQSPASIFSPLLADLSNVLSVLIAYLGSSEIPSDIQLTSGFILDFIKKYGRLLVPDSVDVTNRVDPKHEAIISDDKDLIDAESQLQILHSVTSRMLLNLPKKISKFFY